MVRCPSPMPPNLAWRLHKLPQIWPHRPNIAATPVQAPLLPRAVSAASSLVFLPPLSPPVCSD